MKPPPGRRDRRKRPWDHRAQSGARTLVGVRARCEYPWSQGLIEGGRDGRHDDIKPGAVGLGGKEEDVDGIGAEGEGPRSCWSSGELIATTPGFRRVGEASSGEEAIQAVQRFLHGSC
jgi:hypothetical protein